jgi:hypothetical protein
MAGETARPATNRRRESMIRIISKKEGFRRCGIAFSGTPVDYPNDTFTAQQIAALEAEPMLVVMEVPDDPETNDSETGDLKTNKPKTNKK